MDLGLTGLEESLREGLDELAGLATAVGRGDLAPARAYATAVLETLEGGGKILFCGNGGSAADAQHLAAEYVVRMELNRPAVAALALTTDTSVLTAVSNDQGYDRVFARQVEALGEPGDLLVLHSTSGESANLVAATAAARDRGVKTVALLAKGGGRLREVVDVALVIPTDVTSRAQELHLALGHMVCRFVEQKMAERISAP